MIILGKLIVLNINNLRELVIKAILIRKEFLVDVKVRGNKFLLNFVTFWVTYRIFITITNRQI
jgi:hypothetical protein